MIAASNRLGAHLHALVSRGVQDGLFFRNRAVHGSAAAAVPTGFYRGPVPQQHDHPSGASLPYPRQQSEPWNSKEGAAWRAGGKAGVGGAVGFRRYGGPAGPPSRTGRDTGGGGGSSSRQNPPLPFSGLNMGSRPGQKSARLQGWRWGQGDGDGGGEGAGSNRGGESDAGSVRGEDDARASDDGKQPTSNHSGSVDGSPTREGARGGDLAGEGGPAQDGKGKGKGRQGNAAAAESGTGAVEESPDVSARRSSGQAPPPGPGSTGHKRRSSGRRRASRTEPWVLDLSNSGREDDQRRAGGSGAELSSPQPGYGGARRGRAVEEGGWFRWHGGDNRMFRPLQREEGGGRFSDGRHPSNVSEDGSWEGTVDWWPRPRSPPPVGAGDAYYAPGDYDSGNPGGIFMNPFPGPQGASSLLPAVPTFEESGTRVSWADYRGHSLAEVSRVPSLCLPRNRFGFGTFRGGI